MDDRVITPDDEAHIIFSVDVHDVIAACRLQMDADPDLKRRVRNIRWRIPLGLILVAEIAVILGASWMWLVFALTFAVVLWCSASSGTRAGVARTIRKRFESSSAKGLVGQRELRVTDDGLFTKSSRDEGLHGWAGLCDVVDTGDCLFIYLNPFTAIFVPRERVESGNYDAFAAHVARHTEVRRIKAGESFDRAREAGDDPRPQKRKTHEGLAAFALGAAVLLVWTSTTAEFIGTTVIPRSWPEPLWWLSYNLLIGLPGIGVTALLVHRAAQRDKATLCRQCGHLLKGLSKPQCTECGEWI